MKTLTHQEFKDACDAQGVEKEDYLFKCPACGTLQSSRDFVAAGVGPVQASNVIGFSCIGRFTGQGSAHRKMKAADKGKKGCNWTLGGFFAIHTLEVTRGGQAFPFFELATPQEAQAHAAIHRNEHKQAQP